MSDKSNGSKRAASGKKLSSSGAAEGAVNAETVTDKKTDEQVSACGSGAQGSLGAQRITTAAQFADHMRRTEWRCKLWFVILYVGSMGVLDYASREDPERLPVKYIEQQGEIQAITHPPDTPEWWRAEGLKSLLGFTLRATDLAGFGLSYCAELALVCVVLAYLAVWFGSCLSVPEPGTPRFVVQGYFGRVVFLTRHGIWLQLVHAVFTAIAFMLVRVRTELFDGTLTDYGDAALLFLCRITTIGSVLVGVVGVIVQVLYTALVMPDPVFKQECERTPNPRQHWWVNFFLHAFGIPLALIDVGFLKRGWFKVEPGLLPSNKFVFHAKAFAVFVVYYLTLIYVNQRKTGLWPYGVLEKVHSFGIMGWAVFLLVICGGVIPLFLALFDFVVPVLMEKFVDQ